MRERKRLIRLLVTDVTLIRSSKHITAHVRLPGGQQHTLTIPRPRTAWEQHTTPAATMVLIDELLADHTYDETATILSERRIVSGWGKPFNVTSLTALCRAHNIPSLRGRLTATGMLTLAEVAGDLGAAPATIKKWQRLGLITGRRVDGRREYLYHPGQDSPGDNPRRDATLHRYQTLSEVTATISTARSRHQQPDKTTSSITSSTEGAV